MKLKLIIFLSISLISGLCHADCTQSSQAANQFMDSYIKYNADVFNKKSNETVVEWLQHNKNITDDFKKSYQQLVAKAQKEDPELGLDFDPIFNAQDYPDNGFKIANCDEQTNFVTLAGKDKDWESFKVVVKMINSKTGWLVDGAGVINTPEAKQ